MKRKVLCIFSLVAYLLLFCTCLAPAAEREMAILADIKQVKANTKVNTTLPAYTVQWGEKEGLFHIVEGTGWNTGSRVELIPRQYYSNSLSHIILHPGTEYRLILSASRAPKEGDLVQVADAQESPGEKLIVYCPQGITVMRALQNNFTVLQQGEKGILLDTMSIKMPYFEHRMYNAISDRIMAEGLRIYSYSDAKSFLTQLPLVAVFGGMLLFAVTVWAGTCRMTKQQPGRLPWINGCAMGLTLVLLPLFGKTVDLPASLLPQESILDISHYHREFSNIFAALADVGDKHLQNLCAWCTVAAVAVLLAGVALGIALLWAENRFLKRNTYKSEFEK